MRCDTLNTLKIPIDIRTGIWDTVYVSKAVADSDRTQNGENMRDDQKVTVSNATAALLAALEQGKSEALTAHLAIQARFHHYSLGNILLIASQRPDASRVAGYRTWHDLGRQVRKGEKGILILAPCVAKKREESEEEKTDGRRQAMYFRAVYVFDVAQTEGEALPMLADTLGDPGAHGAALLAFAASKGISVSYNPMIAPARGLSYRAEAKIELLPGQSPAEEFSTLAHEIGHQLLHRADSAEETTRDTRELEAEAVAFVVCTAAGLDAAGSSKDYIQLYRGDAEALTASLGRIHKAAGEILSAAFAADETAVQ